ncbi:hypothetical protein GCM10007989_28280 [Devosia pacifica]|uniref:Uncharacterized protein n=1 Tax=Devosia pacifica TaxID=1335967 RepID=A0A918VWR4_9HYPH|nr:hypothetical protein [Devosia pacifica]GHA30716.1 hypothetical protein GCM10007989_28280 [Devosia pacifica]
MQWLSEHTDTINLFVNVAMLIVWILYLHLLFTTFRQQNRPNILINRSAGYDADSRCLISNMSSSPIYIQAILVQLIKGEHIWQRTISDTIKLTDEQAASQPMASTQQGPLRDGEFLDIGTFGRLAERVINYHQREDNVPDSIADADRIKVTVIAVFTARNHLIGAQRSFAVNKRRNVVSLVPDTVMAEQLIGWRQRRALAAAFTYSASGVSELPEDPTSPTT